MTQHAPHLDETQARQATPGRRVSRILVVSLALVIFAFIVLWVAYFERLSGHGGQSSAPHHVARGLPPPASASPH